MPELRLCPQCYEDKPWPASFIGRRGAPIQWCSDCVAVYRTPGGTGARATRRGKIDARRSNRVLWVPRSLDRKLGEMPATYSAGSTCPDACALKDSGCYAEFGKLGFHWSRVPERGIPWADFLFAVACLAEGELWRHNIAGDLAGDGDELDVRRLLELVLVNTGRRGFSFTHKPLLRDRERLAVKTANARGFTINLSADSLEHADARAKLGVGPVAVTVVSDAPPPPAHAGGTPRRSLPSRNARADLQQLPTLRSAAAQGDRRISGARAVVQANRRATSAAGLAGGGLVIRATTTPPPTRLA